VDRNSPVGSIVYGALNPAAGSTAGNESGLVGGIWLQSSTGKINRSLWPIPGPQTLT